MLLDASTALLGQPFQETFFCADLGFRKRSPMKLAIGLIGYLIGYVMLDA